MQSFTIFVISLPSAIDRRKAIEKQLTSMGVKYEIVPGIFGNDERVIKRYDDKLSIAERGKSLTIGERGCALAHISVYERIIRERIPLALIMEDDMVLPADFMTLVEIEANKVERKWDWLSFDYRYVGWSFLYNWYIATLKTVLNRPTFFFYAVLKFFYITPLSIFEGLRNYFARGFSVGIGARYFYRPLFNAGAYLVTLEGVNKLVPFTNPLRFSADEIPNIARRRINFKFYGYVPLIVKQNTIDFETDAGRTDDNWEEIFNNRRDK